MIKYNKKIDRAFDSKTGHFVKFSIARRSSAFRLQFEPVMLKRKVRALQRGLIEKDVLIEQLKQRQIPSKQWKKIIPPAEKLSPILMYAEMKKSLTKYKYQKAMKEIEKQTTSNKKQRVLRTLYDKHFTLPALQEERKV